MQTLRLTQSGAEANQYRVEAALEGDGQGRQVATSEFDFSLTAQDREDLRWYLEDYLQHDADPAPQIATRIERRVVELGVDLFKKVFQSNDDARDLWATLRDRLNDIRVEIIAGVREAVSLPWELMRDPKTDAPLALRASAFVRAAHQTAKRSHVPISASGPIRILLVICRPGGKQDVPFRSVAGRLIKGLGENAREAFQLDVLRPPTFEQLSNVLRRAKSSKNPYHVVHFDGHGAYVEVPQNGGSFGPLRRLSPLMLSAPRSGSHGYLVFENPTLEGNQQFIDGTTLGKLLAETDVPVLVLNACRSAHAEAPLEPEQAPDAASLALTAANLDVHAKVRAFGSLAQEVVDTGVAGVVAMRYNVYVVTAAQFVADLYKSLTDGRALGEAVSLGRKQLEAQPLREITYTPRALQDWMVPIVYEAAPVGLFPIRAQKAEFKISVSANAAAPGSSSITHELEKRPDAGFFGRDETLLALDRAFDSQHIVLLHAYAGSGKTATAAEFARWYHLTGGIDGPVLFSSFERKTTLSQALNASIGVTFGGLLEQSGIHWLALSDEVRRSMALQVMKQIPILWVWDNVEPIMGFPTGTPSLWNNAEQQALVDFLRAAETTKAKFLLTSRRDERDWLGDLPARIKIPPMPIQERVQLARALAVKNGRHLTTVEKWLPLLRFTQGNPLTLTVVVGQALRDGLETSDQIDAFVSRLRVGETEFENESGDEGREKSLAASLNYGFECAFAEEQRRQLALLYLFQTVVSVVAFRWMGSPDSEWCLPVLRSLTREGGLALFDSAAEIGLLTPMGGGYYSIHPALPWHLKGLYERYYSKIRKQSQSDPNSSTDPSPQGSPIWAYVNAVAKIGSVYAAAPERGQIGAIELLAAEEFNLLNALQLAKNYHWNDPLIDLLFALKQLYEYQGREPEWAKLIAMVEPCFADPLTKRPVVGMEDYWSAVMNWQAMIAGKSKNYQVAEELFDQVVAFRRRKAAPVLSKPKELRTESESSIVFDLHSTLFNFGTILVNAGKPPGIDLLSETFDLLLELGNEGGAADCAFSIGQAYMLIGELYDLDKAELWLRKAIELGDARDSQRHAMRLHELGNVWYARFVRLRDSGETRIEILEDMAGKAARFAYEALELLPEAPTHQLMLIHHLLGNIWDDTGNIDRALKHYRQAILIGDTRGEWYDGALLCREVARCFFKADRLQDALEYANESLRKLQKVGPGARNAMITSQQLIDAIKKSSKKIPRK